MTPRDLFLLLVTGYLNAAFSGRLPHAWDRIKRARQIPEDFWVIRPECSPEKLAFEFAQWSVGEGSRPDWLPFTEEEVRFQEATKGAQPKRQPR